jgi:hypothetical protein
MLRARLRIKLEEINIVVTKLLKIRNQKYMSKRNLNRLFTNNNPNRNMLL